MRDCKPCENAELESANHEKDNLIIALESELKGLKEQVDFERNRTGHLEWVKGQRAIEKLERIRKVKCGYFRTYQEKVKEILAEEG